MYSREAWLVTYEDSDGVTRTTARGFSLSKEDFLGNVMTSEQVQADMMLKKMKAIAFWNRNDKSDRPRLPVSGHPDELEAAPVA
jgi:hypothetical protein